MAAFASGDASISARLHAAERLLRLGNEVQVGCGDISTSQEDLLAGAPFLGGGGEEEPEVFSTPPLTHAPQQSQQGEQGEEDITMCTLPFTQPSPSSPPPSSERTASKPRKPRVCIRKVRCARIRTPTPSPDGRRGGGGTGSSGGGGVDPLYRAVLMIPTTPTPPTASVDILELARQRGIF